MKLLDIYSTLLANWINGGMFVRRDKIHATDINVNYNQIFTKEYTKKVFRISGIKPENVDLAFVDYIREEMFLLHPDVEVIINISNYPLHINMQSDKFNRAMAKASNAFMTYKEAYDSQSGLARLAGKTYRLPGGGRLRITKERLDDLKQVFLSYTYLYNYISGGGTVTLTEVFFELVSKDSRALKSAVSDLYGIFGPINFGLTEVKSVLKTYLDEFGVAAPMPSKLNKKFLPQLLFTDENMAAFSTYKSRGLVGGSGLLLGIDSRSRLPFAIDIFAAPTAQVFLLMGKTGSGKTYAAWQMALSALAMNEYVTAIDIKGREWSRLANYTNYKILTFDERHASFVNTLRLNDMCVTKTNAGELFQTAIQGTVNLLSLIIGLRPEEGNLSDLEMILREAVLKLYSLQGVDPNNPSSFEKTDNMQYSDLLPIMDSLSNTQTYTTEQKKMVSLARSRSYAYIGESGIFAEAFRNEVTLNDVLESPLVIYEFNKNQNAMTDSLDVLRIFMVQFLDSKKKAMLRDRGKFLFCFYEELQRCDQFGNLLEYICADVTGSRSNNAVIILLLNSLRILQGERARDIRSNITSFICGNVEANDITTIREDFNNPWLAEQLSMFAEHQNIFRHSFAASIDTGREILQTVYKVKFPTDVAEHFTTRTVRSD